MVARDVRGLDADAETDVVVWAAREEDPSPAMTRLPAAGFSRPRAATSREMIVG